MRHKCHESLGRVSVVTNALGVQCYSSLERVTYGTSGPGLRRVRDIAEQVPVLAQGAQTSNGVRVNMVDESRPAVTESGWQAKHAYAMAVVCLLLGLLAGYLLRGSESSKAAAAAAAGAAPATPVEAPTQQMPTLEQMKRMADRTAEPLLTKLQSDPKNAALLAQIGKVYESAHQFKEAADYYGKSLEIDPTSVANRNAMASCLYYNGDADGAIAQLEQSLRGDPKNANSLFNLGMVRWKGKNDAQGAAAAWEQLLKSNPSLEANKKAQVEKLLADVRQQGGAH